MSAYSQKRTFGIRAAVYNHFATQRHLRSAAEQRYLRDQAFTAWRNAAYATA
jgi:hypothetical protein